MSTPIDESTETFIWTAHGPGVPLVTYLKNEDEVIYCSERTGWRHLYLVDLLGTSSIRPITEGQYLVRKILHLDQRTRQVDLVVGEWADDQDPYHRHVIRVGIDDSDVTPLTDGNGDHEVEFSPDRRYLIDSCSRIDQPPVHQLRAAADGGQIATLAEAKRIADGGQLSPLPTVFMPKVATARPTSGGRSPFPRGTATPRQLSIRSSKRSMPDRTATTFPRDTSAPPKLPN